MPEWSIGAVSKTVVPLRAPRVRIPVSPQKIAANRQVCGFFFCISKTNTTTTPSTIPQQTKITPPDRHPRSGRLGVSRASTLGYGKPRVAGATIEKTQSPNPKAPRSAGRQHPDKNHPKSPTKKITWPCIKNAIISRRTATLFVKPRASARGDYPNSRPSPRMGTM